MADIIDTILESGAFTYFYDLIEKADLIEQLQGPGPFTLFAPTDEAWAKVAADGTIDVLERHIPSLQQVLLYHAAKGTHRLGDLVNEKTLQTLRGDELIIRTTNGVLINNAKIIESDIEADNGVVHVVDSVVLSRVEAGI